VFFGSNMDAIVEATHVGIAYSACYVAPKAGVESMGRRMRHVVTRYRSTGDVKAELDEADEEDARLSLTPGGESRTPKPN
jgi:hypothetical protein